MRASRETLAAAAFAALAAGCAVKPPGPSVRPEADEATTVVQKPSLPAKRVKASEAEVALVVEGNNAFAFDLYARLREKEGNLVFSPYSISTALAMTYAGAFLETASQMYSTLRFPCEQIQVDREPAEAQVFMNLPWDQRRLHGAFASLVDDLNARGDGNEGSAYELVVANRLWGQKGYRFLEPFLKLNRTCYGAGLEQVDFAGATEAARKTINAWVENKTRDKIKELLKPPHLTPLTRLVLTSAIYFKGSWASRFKTERTSEAFFHVTTAKKVEVPMMCQTEDFMYAKTEASQILEMSYARDELSMVILLPKKTDGLAELEASFDGSALKGWLSRLRKRKVGVFLPRFKAAFGHDLVEVLKTMGMPLPFDVRKADFSGITDNPEGLYIGAVIHEACVDVNEEGTEAAAATAVVMKPGNGGGLPVFRADHPFIFLIRDRRTGSILFIGRVMNPTG